MLLDRIREAILAAASTKVSGTGWHNAVCPLCVSHGETKPSKQRKGGFKFGGDVITYRCFRCHFQTSYRQGRPISGRFKEMLQAFHIDAGSIAQFELEAGMPAVPGETAAAVEPPPPPAPEYAEVQLPTGARLLSDADDDHIGYLYDRGFTQPADFHDVHVTDFRMFDLHRRIIIPFRDRDGRIIGWSGRHIDAPLPPQKTKYHQQKAPHAIYGLNHIAGRRHVFVVEGVLDAKIVNGVALCGSVCSPEQADMLDTFPAVKVVVRDNDEAGDGLGEALGNRRNWKLSYIPKDWGCKDVADACLKFGRHYVADHLLRHCTIDFAPLMREAAEVHNALESLGI